MGVGVFGETKERGPGGKVAGQGRERLERGGLRKTEWGKGRGLCKRGRGGRGEVLRMDVRGLGNTDPSNIPLWQI